MIEQWSRTLADLGFESRAERVYRRSAGDGFLDQCIFESPFKHEPRYVAIKLAITLRDRFNERLQAAVHLCGFLSPREVVLEWYGDAHRWDDDASTALHAFANHGMKWLEHYAQVPVLIQHFERELQDGIPDRHRPTWYSKVAERMLLRQGGLAGRPGPRRPPIDHYFLSLLYDRVGDAARALGHAQTFRRVAFAEEAARMDRQIAILEADSTAAGAPSRPSGRGA